MKTMRYRIRLISLLLCLAILGAALWNLRSLWQPAMEGSLLPAPASSPEMTAVPVGVSPSPGVTAVPVGAAPSPGSTAVPAGVSPAPGITPVPVGPSSSPEPSPSVSPAASPDPVFNTFGL